MLKTSDDVKLFLSEAKFPQPCFIEQMEFKVVIRSPSCKFAVLVTSGLKIIPRCSECMAYTSPQQYMNEEVVNSHSDMNIKVEVEANSNEGCVQTRDEDECLNTDDSENEANEDDNTFRKTRVNLDPQPNIKTESSAEKVTQQSYLNTEGKESNILSNEPDDFGDPSDNSTKASIPESKNKSTSSSVLNSKSDDEVLLSNHQTSSAITTMGNNIGFSDNIQDVREVMNKLPKSVTVTRVPKMSIEASPVKSFGNRKHRDVIVTSSGKVVLENVHGNTTPIINQFRPNQSWKSLKIRPRRREIGRNHGCKVKSQRFPILPRMSKKSTSYVKINETCKLCLHHFTVKQAFDRDQNWHEQKFDLKSGVTCPICQMYIGSKFELTDHFKGYHPELGTCCCECLQVKNSFIIIHGKLNI